MVASEHMPDLENPHADDPVFALHAGGKMEIASRVALNGPDELSMAYTPGVARVCEAIAEDPALADDYTWVSNTVAIVTDGTAVLGLGDIGPKAAMPVMEGKAVLFKQFGGVDALPICLDTTDVDEIVETVTRLAPSFGGVNLEDISAPRCFEIEDRLKQALDIPVFHDDQHGTAVVVLAALIHAAVFPSASPGWSRWRRMFSSKMCRSAVSSAPAIPTSPPIGRLSLRAITTIRIRRSGDGTTSGSTRRFAAGISKPSCPRSRSRFWWCKARMTNTERWRRWIASPDTCRTRSC